MCTRYLILLLLIFPFNHSSSREGINDAKIFNRVNSLNIELFGFTPLGTVYYERLLINKNKFKTSGQIGFGVEGIPVIANEILSLNNNHFELGLGILLPEKLFSDSRDITRPFLTGRIGYRYQKPDGRFVFRAGIMPIATQDEYGINAFTAKTTYIWPGFSFGYAF